MTPPAMKRFDRDYAPIADAVARLDIDQEVREQVADALTDALTGRADFRPDLFRLLASDPLVPCAGYDRPDTGEHVPCPYDRTLRIAMHLSDAPDGRSEAWRPRIPEIKCGTCGGRAALALAEQEAGR